MTSHESDGGSKWKTMGNQRAEVCSRAPQPCASAGKENGSEEGMKELECSRLKWKGEMKQKKGSRDTDFMVRQGVVIF